MRDREVDFAHASGGDQALRAAGKADSRTAAGRVRYADAPPRNSVVERLARGLFCGKESGEPLRYVPLAQRVGHLFLGVHPAPEPRHRTGVEAVTLNFREVQADTKDHGLAFEGRDKFSGLGRRTGQSGMESTIRIIPVNAIDRVFLDRLALCLEERFLARVHLERALAIARSSLNATRGQLFLSTLVSKVLSAHPAHDGVLLVLTEFDLYKTSQRFIFGDADKAHAVATVSLHRLRPEFYGEEADANLVFQRTLKECVHELGRIFGLKHCYNARCGMYYSNSIFETDNKTSYFCETCDRRAGKARN